MKIINRSINEIHFDPDETVGGRSKSVPRAAGISEEVIRHFHKSVPILGVCLGHQAIGEVFGSKVVAAPHLMHGKASRIFHDGRTIFRGLPQGFNAARYHSLIVTDVPGCLEVSATTEDGLVMALRHHQFAVEGIQFHPESIMTEFGREILKNFVNRKDRR